MKLRILTLAVFVAGAAHAQTLPTAVAGDDITENCAPPAGLEVTLSSAGSTDGDGDVDAIELMYSWLEFAGTPEEVVLSNEASPMLTFAPGVHTVTLVVDDGVDGTAMDEVIVTIEADVTPPEIVMAENGDVLFPPNHKTHPYAIADIVESVSDDCTEMTIEDVVFGHATSDELDNGTGDGNTTGDVDFKDCSEVRVRAERDGSQDGRVYLLHLHADDAAGNRGSESYEIGVPHDMGKGHEAVAGGTMAEYASACFDGDGPAACAPAPSECADASSSSLGYKGGKNPALRFSAAGAVPADGAPIVCLYEDGALVGGADSLGKVKVKGDAVSAAAKGNSVMVPDAVEGALRAEYHAGDACLAASFEDGKQGKAGTFKARNR